MGQGNNHESASRRSHSLDRRKSSTLPPKENDQYNRDSVHARSKSFPRHLSSRDASHAPRPDDFGYLSRSSIRRKHKVPSEYSSSPSESEYGGSEYSGSESSGSEYSYPDSDHTGAGEDAQEYNFADGIHRRKVKVLNSYEKPQSAYSHLHLNSHHTVDPSFTQFIPPTPYPHYNAHLSQAEYPNFYAVAPPMHPMNYPPQRSQTFSPRQSGASHPPKRYSTMPSDDRRAPADIAHKLNIARLKQEVREQIIDPNELALELINIEASTEDTKEILQASNLDFIENLHKCLIRGDAKVATSQIIVEYKHKIKLHEELERLETLKKETTLLENIVQGEQNKREALLKKQFEQEKEKQVKDMIEQKVTAPTTPKHLLNENSFHLIKLNLEKLKGNIPINHDNSALGNKENYISAIRDLTSIKSEIIANSNELLAQEISNNSDTSFPEYVTLRGYLNEALKKIDYYINEINEHKKLSDTALDLINEKVKSLDIILEQSDTLTQQLENEIAKQNQSPSPQTQLFAPSDNIETVIKNAKEVLAELNKSLSTIDKISSRARLIPNLQNMSIKLKKDNCDKLEKAISDTALIAVQLTQQLSQEKEHGAYPSIVADKDLSKLNESYATLLQVKNEISSATQKLNSTLSTPLDVPTHQVAKAEENTDQKILFIFDNKTHTWKEHTFANKNQIMTEINSVAEFMETIATKQIAIIGNLNHLAININKKIKDNANDNDQEAVTSLANTQNQLALVRTLLIQENILLKKHIAEYKAEIDEHKAANKDTKDFYGSTPHVKARSLAKLHATATAELQRYARCIKENNEKIADLNYTELNSSFKVETLPAKEPELQSDNKESSEGIISVTKEALKSLSNDSKSNLNDRLKETLTALTIIDSRNNPQYKQDPPEIFHLSPIYSVNKDESPIVSPQEELALRAHITDINKSIFNPNISKEDKKESKEILNFLQKHAHNGDGKFKSPVMNDHTRLKDKRVALQVVGADILPIPSFLKEYNGQINTALQANKLQLGLFDETYSKSIMLGTNKERGNLAQANHTVMNVAFANLLSIYKHYKKTKNLPRFIPESLDLFLKKMESRDKDKEYEQHAYTNYQDLLDHSDGSTLYDNKLKDRLLTDTPKHLLPDKILSSHPSMCSNIHVPSSDSIAKATQEHLIYCIANNCLPPKLTKHLKANKMYLNEHGYLYKYQANNSNTANVTSAITQAPPSDLTAAIDIFRDDPDVREIIYIKSVEDKLNKHIKILKELLAKVTDPTADNIDIIWGNSLIQDNQKSSTLLQTAINNLQETSCFFNTLALQRSFETELRDVLHYTTLFSKESNERSHLNQELNYTFENARQLITSPDMAYHFKKIFSDILSDCQPNDKTLSQRFTEELETIHMAPEHLKIGKLENLMDKLKHACLLASQNQTSAGKYIISHEDINKEFSDKVRKKKGACERTLHQQQAHDEKELYSLTQGLLNQTLQISVNSDHQKELVASRDALSTLTEQTQGIDFMDFKERTIDSDNTVTPDNSLSLSIEDVSTRSPEDFNSDTIPFSNPPPPSTMYI